MTVFISRSEAETERIASDFAATLKPGDVIAYRGGLGAGKTAFTRGLAKGLGIDTDEVSSPTFSILNVYKNGKIILCHFDMYRINGYESLLSTGFFDYLDGVCVVAVEWSENIAEELPREAITVTLISGGDNTRRIEIEGGGRF